MKTNESLLKFVETGKTQGLPDESLVRLLKARGWPQEAIYEALAAHYENTTGLQIPVRSRSGAAARDAFYYLLAFSMLATWTIGFGSLMFTLIEKWIADPLLQNAYAYTTTSYFLASSIASILVAFPIYLFVMRLIVREVRIDSEKLESSVRKWLTYIALLIATAVMVGDLVTVLAFFLRGEVTSQFLAKAATVVVISGAVLWYYLGELKRPACDSKGSLDSRDTRAAIGASAAVALAVVLGFMNLGAPSNQRLVQADTKRVQNLVSLAYEINAKWSSSNRRLPSTAEALQASRLKDPLAQQPYEYRPKGENAYELCATFDRDSRKDQEGPNAFWGHPKGRFCFTLDPSEIPAPGYN